SAPFCFTAASSTVAPTSPGPGFFTRALKDSATSGPSRNRKVFASRWLSLRRGGRRSFTTTSVAVTGRHFPERIRKGTPSHRQEETWRRTAAYVSTWEAAATPG